MKNIYRLQLIILVAISISLFALPAAARLLLISPHPDDDVAVASGIVYRALQRSEPVMVVYVTNGDYVGTTVGYLRQNEAVDAMVSHLGMIEDDLIFLGYPDGYLRNVLANYPDSDDVFAAPNGQSSTYGNRGLGRSDFHTYAFGVPASYNRSNMVLDLATIISSFLPDHIFLTSEFDTHSDHRATSTLLDLALENVVLDNPVYNPTLHKTIVWCGDTSWPNALDPTAFFDEIPTLSETNLLWEEAEHIDVPLVMQSLNLSTNPKYLALESHESQGGAAGDIGRFLHKTEFFWVEQFIGPNAPPVVNAGLDQTAEENAVVTLYGAGSFDHNGDLLTYQWVQVLGSPVSLSDPAAANPTFVAPSGLARNEVLVFELTVSDSILNSIPDAVTVTTIAATPTLAPVANAGPAQTVNEGVLVQLDGSGSYDPDGDRLSYQWTQTAGLSVILSDPAAMSPTFTAPAGLTVNEVLSFQLQVSDGRLSSNPSIVGITVLAAQDNGGSINVAGLALVRASSEKISSGQAAIKAVDGVVDGYPGDATREWATEHEGAGAWLELTWSEARVIERVVLYDRPNRYDQILSATISFSDGSTVTTGRLDNLGLATEVTFSPRSTTSLRVTVNQVSSGTWDTGLAEIEVFEVIWTGGNRVPVASAGPPQTVNDGVLVQLDGSGSYDPDGDLLSYQWTQTSGFPVVLSNPAAMSPTFNAPAGLTVNEVLSFQLQVSDGQLSSNLSSVDITVLAPQDTGGGSNVAGLALVRASSEKISSGQAAVKAIDGVVDGYPGDATREWATEHEGAGAWLELTWSEARVIERVVLYDRPNRYDQILSATISFSDGSTVTTGRLDNLGLATEVTFSPRSTTSLRVTVNQVSGGTWDIGLAEIEVFAAIWTGENRAPVASAGSPQTVNEGVMVQLDGSGSYDPDGDALSYQWTQTAGLPVVLSNPAAISPTFTAPTGLTVNEALAFQLQVSDGQLSSNLSSVGITVLAPQDTGGGTNVAGLALVRASSEKISSGQAAVKAIDGVVDGYPEDATREWATEHEGVGAWLELTWSEAQVVERVVLYDRPNRYDQILSATITFSDGSTVTTGPLDNLGLATEVTFSPRSVSGLRVTVNQVSRGTWDIGLAEIEVF